MVWFWYYKGCFGNMKMIQVLDRACDILELLADEPERARGLSEVAGPLGLNAGTCANILKTLVERDYVEQEAPKKGYRLGPMAYMLARRGPFGKDLLAAAEGAIRELAARVQETVLLVTLRRGRRYTLTEINGSRGIQVRSELTTDAHIYRTATGRLLLAYLSEPELDAVLAEHGMPGHEWTGVSTRAQLVRALGRIRRADMVVYETHADVTAMAVPVRERGQPVAALGLFLPTYRYAGAHKKAVLAGMKRTVATITDALDRNLSTTTA